MCVCTLRARRKLITRACRVFAAYPRTRGRVALIATRLVNRRGRARAEWFERVRVFYGPSVPRSLRRLLLTDRPVHRDPRATWTFVFPAARRGARTSLVRGRRARGWGDAKGSARGGRIRLSRGCFETASNSLDEDNGPRWQRRKRGERATTESSVIIDFPLRLYWDFLKYFSWNALQIDQRPKVLGNRQCDLGGENDCTLPV